ncbi:MAG: hypothetical protein HYR91_13110 [Flavobacteriia bacterium]|nr:hypothetical protein [Flavobacteriia bacterium]
MMILIISCTSRNKETRKNINGQFENELTQIVQQLNEECKECCVKYNYKRDIYFLILNKHFTDNPKLLTMILNYTRYKFSNKNHENIFLAIKFSNKIYLNNQKTFLKNEIDYYSKIDYALKNINSYDAVYFSLTSEISNEDANYTFKGNIWELIDSFAQKKKNADINFLAFYNWCKIPYSDELKFNQHKLDFYVRDLGLDPKKINDNFIDSIFLSRTGKTYFKY